MAIRTATRRRALVLATCALPIFPLAAQRAPYHEPPPEQSTIVVVGAHNDDTPAKLDHISPEVDGTKITVTKKTSVTKLNLVPTVIDNNQRQLFARLPGLLVTDQQTPSQFNLNYRGLGNPQESEFVLALQDGLPISTDWIGFPTLYYQPLPQGIARVELIRGGSSLLYGPNPAPALNFVSKRPTPGEPIGGYSENVGGSDGLFSTYNAIEGTSGKFEFRAAFGATRSDGQRQNAGSRLLQGDVYLAYRASKDQLWYVDVNHYDVSAGDPGRIGYSQFQSDPNYAPTPYNRDWVRRTAVTLGNQSNLGNGWKLDAKAWFAWQNLSSRAAANQAPGAAAPTTTTITDEEFRSQGIDARLVKRWGHGNALTVGAVGYHDSAPYLQWTSTNLVQARDDHSGTPRLNQDRDSTYAAIFAENVFRLPHSWHIVPSVRVERESIDINETVRPPFLTRSLIDEKVVRWVPLGGLGAGFDFGNQNETYFSVTQGYRPLRFFDVASPFANVGPGNVADPSKSLSFEAGVHGTPIKGLFYDAGLFWIDFRNRIETITLSATDSVNRNSGNTRHRGFEGELSYDFLAGNKSGRHLTAFGNLSLLDATFTKSLLVDRAGDTPAYAPHVIAKYGISIMRDRRYDLSVSGQTVSSQYWQDSDLPIGTGASFIPAKVPGYTVVDISGDYYLTKNLRLLGGISNVGNRKYYVRVFQNGIEPARTRKIYGGVAVGF
ncbi:TonB-dependent receptor family protein [Sphingomonas nostoxanthinifaciens]|uniref:TonB-dependent receptor family protein n=1 Tax=Sphingomonas nostoxanthinifaciens TaxID=2872652 RepID=UPI001CC1EEF6|nr:TonB-dependent receptor [Sphingomonas nostoxanthinifaciens]UAK23224.1 TonB-dependent receptor [Sphingomonas nostoxanthinifaciens]